MKYETFEELVCFILILNLSGCSDIILEKDRKIKTGDLSQMKRLGYTTVKIRLTAYSQPKHLIKVT